MDPSANLVTDTTNRSGSFIVDTIKAALPVGGGSVLANLHSADVVVTFATHIIGLCAAAVGLAWYIVRLRRDLRNRSKTSTEN
jgi:ABC-type phosphate/phosphonate transport system ATPase subunit